MTALQEIDAAVRGLRAAGCVRDPATGSWLTRDQLVLDCNPLAAAAQLRREKLRTAVESELRRSGGRFNRAYIPDASR